MDALGSLIELGIDCAPVPGLKPAFEILKFIWENVQKASNNRKALRNLAVSTAEILIAVNHVLSRSKFNEHVRVLLRNLETVLNDICTFSEEHVSMNLFKILIKNVDIEGKIEFFQNRLQNLSMAFNIAAYGAIEAQLEKVLYGQHNPKSLASFASKQGGQEPQPRIEYSKKPLPQRTRITEYSPMRVEASFGEPCRIEIREVPVLTCLYFPEVDFVLWGLGVSESKVIKKRAGFDIVRIRDQTTWSWTALGKNISVSAHRPSTPDWKDMIDIVFPSPESAAGWFSWLETYTSPATPSQTPPPSYDVKVRKKYECWMQKTPAQIERRLPTSSRWIVTLGGTLQNARVYATHFTYINGGKLPFNMVYRSGNTLVLERFIRADDEEPTAARRYRFDTEEDAQDWYAAWKECITFNEDQIGGDEPIRVEITFKEPLTLQLRNRVPTLDTALAPHREYQRQLRRWGLEKPNASVTCTETELEVATLTTTWTWMLRDKYVTVYAAVASQPDWLDSLEIVFLTAKSSALWFAYLIKYRTTGLPPSLPPRAEHVTVTETRVCWMQKTETSIQRRMAVSEEWIPIFGKYRSMEIYQSHLALVGDSILPHLRVTRGGHALFMERRAFPNDSDVPMSRRYQFSSEAEAKAWYDVWKEHLRR